MRIMSFLLGTRNIRVLPLLRNCEDLMVKLPETSPMLNYRSLWDTRYQIRDNTSGHFVVRQDSRTGMPA